MPIEYKTRKDSKCGCTIVEFQIPGGVLDYEELEEAVRKAPEVDTTQGVCLSGRGPVWLFMALARRYYPTAWVGSFDPRTIKCIVTETHVPGVKIGETRELEE